MKFQERQPRKKSILGWQSKKFKIKARKIPRNAAYLAVREIPRDAAQHRYWTFYEAINIAFTDLVNLLQLLGFDMRIKGSHHIFRKGGIEEKPNLQKDGNKAKPYQVKQVRNLILKYKLGVNDDK